MNKKYNGEKSDILDFLYASDCNATMDVQHCKSIYEVIKDYDDNICYGCMRVLEPDGLLVSKWNEDQIALLKVLKVFGTKPLLGDQRGKTRWLLFMK